MPRKLQLACAICAQIWECRRRNLRMLMGSLVEQFATGSKVEPNPDILRELVSMRSSEILNEWYRHKLIGPIADIVGECYSQPRWTNAASSIPEGAYQPPVR